MRSSNQKALVLTWIKATSIAVVLLIGVITTNYSSAIAAQVTKTPTLGLSVSVLPEDGGLVSPIQAGLVHSLALTIQPGTSSIRKIRIQSAAPNSELVTTSIGYASLINSVLTLDDQKVSPIAKWIKVARPKIELPAKKTVDVALEITVPHDEPIGIRQAYLLVKATMPDTNLTTTADRNGAARYAIPIYIGVGTTTQIVTDFSVGLISLVNTTGGMAFSIPLTNTGMTPVLPIGYILLNSVLGQLIFAAKIPFGDGVIEPGQATTVEVLVPAEVPDAVWNVHAEAHAGTLLATSDSIVTLNRGGLLSNNNVGIYRTLLGVISLVLFILIILYLRKDRHLRAVKNQHKE